MFESLNATFNESKFGQYFKLKERGSNLTTEFNGAVATFLTMAYILAVNPSILADSGGTCDAGALGGPYDNPVYDACKEDVKRQMIVATALTSMLACLLMGLWANLPIALSCGMGMNAYFTFNLVGFNGTGNISYQGALAAVLLEGIVFFILAVTGLRYYLIKVLFPEPVRQAVPAAIGAFLAHLGLQTAEGIGVVVGDIATGVTLGGCPVDKRDPMVALSEFFITSDNYTCDTMGGKMTSPTTWIGIFGFFLMGILLSYKVRSSFMISIGLVTILSWIRGTGVTYFPDTAIGNNRFDYFQKVVSVEGLDLIFAKYDFSEMADGNWWIGFFTLLYVDFLDTSGTLLAMLSSMDFMKEDGDFEKSRAAFSADAIATVFGSLFGLSPITSYIESAAGIEIGSRTGLTSVFVGFFFFLSIFFAPILASIPAWATGGSLIIVGALMARSLVNVKWENPAHAITAFTTVIVMPLTYSIAYGLIAGIMTWMAFKLVFIPLSYLGIPDPTAEVEVKEGESNDLELKEDSKFEDDKA